MEQLFKSVLFNHRTLNVIAYNATFTTITETKDGTNGYLKSELLGLMMLSCSQVKYQNESLAKMSEIETINILQFRPSLQSTPVY